MARDTLFATLDPTTRRLPLPTGREVAHHPQPKFTFCDIVADAHLEASEQLGLCHPGVIALLAYIIAGCTFTFNADTAVDRVSRLARVTQQVLYHKDIKVRRCKLMLPAGAAVRHGRLHPEAADAAGGRIPRHPGGNCRSLPAAACCGPLAPQRGRAITGCHAGTHSRAGITSN